MRNIEPGSIDTNYVPSKEDRQDKYDSNGRNISPGIGHIAKMPKRSDRSSTRNAAPEGGVFDMEVISIIKLTGQMLCPVRGCTYQSGGQPHEFKTDQGLRKHLDARHGDVNALYVMRTIYGLGVLNQKRENVQENHHPK